MYVHVLYLSVHSEVLRTTGGNGKAFFPPLLFHMRRAACGAMLEFYSQYFHSILMFLLFLKSQLSPHQVIDSISDFNLEPQKCSASSARQCGDSQLWVGIRRGSCKHLSNHQSAWPPYLVFKCLASAKASTCWISIWFFSTLNEF